MTDLHAQEPSGSEQGEWVLRFKVANLWFGIAVAHVQEVIPYVTPTPIPLAPNHISGLIEFRGYAVPLLDLEQFFAQTPTEIALDLRGSDLLADEGHQRIVIASATRMRVGLICDQIRGIVQLRSEARIVNRLTRSEQLTACTVAEFDNIEGEILISLNFPLLLERARV